jgi:hypothetical protein
MKHIIEFSQIEFYKENRYLELEGILSESKFQSLVYEILQKRGQIKKKYSDRSLQFIHSHDLFMEIDDLKRFLSGPVIANILSDLCQENFFRLLFDQIISYPLADNYPSIVNLNDLSFQGTAMGMLIHLGGAEINSSPLFPKKKGNITFFDPNSPLILEEFKIPTSAEFLLVAYGLQDARYRHKENDPHTHIPKNYGYGFGDSLTNKVNPLLFVK